MLLTYQIFSLRSMLRIMRLKICHFQHSAAYKKCVKAVYVCVNTSVYEYEYIILKNGMRIV